MIPDAWTHFFIMLGLVICSIGNKSDRQFILILCIYAAAWQVSDYLSKQEDVGALFKIVFQTGVSTALIYYVTLLKYTRFTKFFMALVFIGVASYFVMVILDKNASIAAYNYGVDVFSLLNIQLIYLELLAMAGITFDMGSDKGSYIRSINSYLHGTTSSSGAMAYSKKSYGLAQK